MLNPKQPKFSNAVVSVGQTEIKPSQKLFVCK